MEIFCLEITNLYIEITINCNVLLNDYKSIKFSLIELNR